MARPLSGPIGSTVSVNPEPPRAAGWASIEPQTQRPGVGHIRIHPALITKSTRPGSVLRDTHPGRNVPGPLNISKTSWPLARIHSGSNPRFLLYNPERRFLEMLQDGSSSTLPAPTGLPTSTRLAEASAPAKGSSDRTMALFIVPSFMMLIVGKTFSRPIRPRRKYTHRDSPAMVTAELLADPQQLNIIGHSAIRSRMTSPAAQANKQLDRDSLAPRR